MVAELLKAQLRVMQAVLACEYNVLYSDVAVVFLRDFMPTVHFFGGDPDEFCGTSI